MTKLNIFLLFIITLMTVLYSDILYCQQSDIPPGISKTAPANGTFPKHWHETKGFGTNTKGGIAGEVYKVTNLNSSGAGSLRDAVSKSNRLVVFEVGGVIEGGFSVASNVTIAGQTAPYPGITTIKGNIRTDGSNIVISHITHHLGTKVSGHPDAWNVSGSNIVLDHAAVYWGKDETLPLRNTTNVTLYKCIIAEGLQFTGHEDGEHSKGLHIQSGNSKLSVIGSLGAHNALRNPRLDGGEAFLANYVVYNWGTGWDHKGPEVYSDDELAGCTQCFKKVISLRADANVTLVGSIGLGGFDSEAEYFLDGHNGKGTAYILDNIIKDQLGNDLKMANTEGEFTGGASGPSGAITLLDSPRIWPEGMEPLPADEALYEVLRTVGPHPGIRNGHNARLVKSVADGTGEIIDSEDEVGGYPNYPAIHRPITVPDGAEARQAWLDDLENEVAVDTSIDLSRLYTMVGSEASDKLRNVTNIVEEERGIKIPTTRALNNAYPNPFNPSTNIEFQIPKKEHVNISVFNLLGESVATLIDQDINIGTHTVTFNGSGLPSGVYIYQMKTAGFMENKKMMLLK